MVQKKRYNVLIISPTLPHPDSGAGESRAYQFCTLLSRSFSVFILPLQYPWGQSSFIARLKREGISVIFPGFRGAYSIPALLDKVRFDYAFFELFYAAIPFLPYFSRFKKTIIDTQELHFLKLERKKQLFKNTSEAASGIKESELALYRACDALVTVSPHEETILRNLFPHKEIRTIPLWSEKSTKNASFPFEKRKDIVFFGLMERDVNYDAACFLIKDIFPRIRRVLPGVTLHIAGHGAGLLKHTLTTTTARGLVFKDRITDIPSYLRRFRLFIAPLRFGAGQKKKILDAITAGCPVITTPVGAEGYALKNNTEILLATSPKELARKAVSLYTDKKQWAAVSRNALSRARHLNLCDVDETVIEKNLLSLFTHS